MLLFRPRDFLFALLPLITGNTSLSAFDIPVELPSGQTIHLNMEYAEVDPDLYSVYIKSTIEDPEELRLFSENPNALELMSQSLKEKWELHDFSFRLSEPITSLTLGPALEVFRNYPPLTLSSINDLGTGIQTLGGSGTLTLVGSSIAGCATISSGQLIGPNSLTGGSLGGAIFINAGTLTLTDSTPMLMIEAPMGAGVFLTQDQIQQIKEGTLTSIEATNGQTVKITSVASNEKTGQKTDASETSLSISPKPADVKSDATLLTDSSALANGIDNSQEKTKEDPAFILRFSTSGNNFGGGWRLAPYELSFIQKQASFWDKGYPSDGIETMAVLVAPDESGLYQKRYAYPDFFPAQTTLNVLTAHPDGTFMLNASLRGAFFFNSDGQLIRSLREEGPYSTYDYSDEKLTRIRHADCLDLSFEYEGKKVININGLPNKIHLEYDDRDLLCKISDEQGSFLQISYDEDTDLDKIVDDSGAILFGNKKSKKESHEGEEIDAIPLLFNGDGEVFYYKDGKNNLRISYRSWDLEDDEQDE